MLCIPLWIRPESFTFSHITEKSRGFCEFLARVLFCHEVFESFNHSDISSFLFLRSTNTSKQLSHDRRASWNTTLWKNSRKKDRRRFCLLCPAVSSGSSCMCEADDVVSFWTSPFWTFIRLRTSGVVLEKKGGVLLHPTQILNESSFFFFFFLFFFTSVTFI